MPKAILGGWWQMVSDFGRATLRTSGETVLVVLTASGLALAMPVFAQQYPVKPVRILVGFAPGGGPALERLEKPEQRERHQAGEGLNDLCTALRRSPRTLLREHFEPSSIEPWLRKNIRSAMLLDWTIAR